MFPTVRTSIICVLFPIFKKEIFVKGFRREQALQIVTMLNFIIINHHLNIMRTINQPDKTYLTVFPENC